ncbi:MAG: hypothetical protein AABW90_02340 [Nanoarchaeota archaeon]
MVNYYNVYGLKSGELIAYILKKPSNDLVLECKRLGENLREAVKLDIKKLCVAKALSNIETRFRVLD